MANTKPDASQINYTAAGGVMRTQAEVNLESRSALDVLTAAQRINVLSGTGSLDVTAAVQSLVLASVGMTTLSDSPTTPKFKVRLPAGSYGITTLYVPDQCVIEGDLRATTLNALANAPVIVLGRSIGETTSIRVDISDINIKGTLSGTSQIGIRCGVEGANALVYNARLRRIFISDMGASGLYWASSTIDSLLLYSDWDQVVCQNCGDYGAYFRFGVVNQNMFNNCIFTYNKLGGVLIDYVGGGTTNFSESNSFRGCSFEANGQQIGGGAVFTVGSFGFKSVMSGGQYVFDNCYIELNAMQAADTTGAAVYCQQPVMLSIRNSYIAGGNNLIYLYKGGNAEIEGCYIDPFTNNTSLFTFDTPPTGSVESYLRVGLNQWYTQYITPAKMSRSINGATTQIIGYRHGRNNYLVNQPRSKNLVLRDRSDVDADTGAIGYNAVRRLTNNADSTYNIGVNGVSSICVQNTYTLALISDTYNSKSALFLLTPTGMSLISQAGGTLYTVTKDTASSINVYYDAGTGHYVLQNKTATTLSYVAVRFIGAEAMLSADNYNTYENKFLPTTS